VTAPCTRSSRRFAAAAITAAALAGCGSNSGKVSGLSVGEVLARHVQGSVSVHGYLLAPADDRMRLCAKLNSYADCRGKPSLLVVGLDPARVPGLTQGCCALGYRSRHELTLRGRLVGRTLHVGPASAGNGAEAQ
jgi:hypothetical protein